MRRMPRWLPLLLLLASRLPAQDDPRQALQRAGEAKDHPGAGYLAAWDRSEVRVEESGLSHVEKDVLYKVLTEAGAAELKALTFGYDPLSAWVEVRELTVLRAGGAAESVPLTAVRDYPAPARAIYWGAREIVAPVGRLEPGDGVRVRTYQKGFTYALLADPEPGDERYIPPMRGHFYDIVPFWSSFPVKVKSYRVRLPASKRLQFEFYHGEARHWAHSEGEQNVYFWEKTDIRPLAPEPDMVDPSDVAPKLLLSTSPDWQTKSRWFYKVNEDYPSFAFDPEIKAKTEEIIRGARDDWERISRLTHWVAEEIRYSGISMGPGEGFTLHKGTMTFADRCGVCKDKAGMLVTMLRAAGFESYPAMTMAGSRIDRIPADQFNHSVTVVKLADGYHLLDPTWVPGVRELWSSAEQQQEYLMGLPEGADLQSTPLSPPEKHYLRYTLRSELDAAGTLRGTARIEAEGQTDSGLRRTLTRSPRPRWAVDLEREIRRLHPALVVRDLRFSDPNDLSAPMRVEFRYEIPGWLTGDGQLVALKPLAANPPLASLLSFNRMNPGLEARTYPFRTRCSQRVELQETLQLPAAWKWLNPPGLKPVSGGGADYAGAAELRGRTLTVRHQLSMKKRIYQPGDWPSVRDAVREWRKLADKAMILDRGGEK